MNTENLTQNYLWKVSNKQYNDNLSQLSPEEIANLHQKNYVQTVASLYQEEENSSYMNMLMCKELELYSSAVDGKSSMVTPAPNQMLSWKNSMSVGGIQQVMKIMNLSHSSKVVFTPQTDNNHCMLLQSPEISPYNGSEIISNNKGYENVKSLNLPNANCQDFNPKRQKRQRVDEVSEEMSSNLFEFRSAREQLEINETKNCGSPKTNKYGNINVTNKLGKKSLGSRPRNQCFSKFIPPTGKGKEDQSTMDVKEDAKSVNSSNCKIKGIEPQLVELILSEIMDHGPTIEWDDIAGLEYAKATIKEIVVWPLLRPDIFTGLRGPPKGILLFGPPGTGKTLIGKCIASQSGATFFSISASSLTSKWIGQGEKLVRALFVVAKLHQPSVIFIDEIDSLLSQRSDTEHESSRRIKTEFFVQLDGATTVNEDRILVVGATNRPQEIDEAARRRLVKRLYIPLPDDNARNQIITKLLSQQSHGLNEKEINIIVHGTEGYSGADVTNLCKDAALGPIRSLKVQDISNLHKDDVRQIEIIDFEMALTRVKPSVSPDDITSYIKWNKLFGCGSF